VISIDHQTTLHYCSVSWIDCWRNRSCFIQSEAAIHRMSCLNEEINGLVVVTVDLSLGIPQAIDKTCGELDR